MYQQTAVQSCYRRLLACPLVYATGWQTAFGTKASFLDTTVSRVKATGEALCMSYGGRLPSLLSELEHLFMDSLVPTR